MSIESLEDDLARALERIEVLTVQLEAMTNERLTAATFMRLTEWLATDPIKSAATALPVGFERQIAYAIEMDLLPIIKGARIQAAHWKANHDHQVEAARVLIERPDVPFERVIAYRKYDEYRRGHARYEAVRKMTPRQFLALWDRNLRGGERFDDLVDDMVNA